MRDKALTLAQLLKLDTTQQHNYLNSLDHNTLACMVITMAKAVKDISDNRVVTKTTDTETITTTYPQVNTREIKL